MFSWAKNVRGFIRKSHIYSYRKDWPASTPGGHIADWASSVVAHDASNIACSKSAIQKYIPDRNFHMVTGFALGWIKCLQDFGCFLISRKQLFPPSLVVHTSNCLATLIKNHLNIYVRVYFCWAPVAHSCNPSYSRSRDQEDHGWKPAWANSSRDPILKKPFTKQVWWSGSNGRAPA
jgi:hypothetical protein